MPTKEISLALVAFVSQRKRAWHMTLQHWTQRRNYIYNAQAFGTNKWKSNQAITNDLDDWYEHDTSNFALNPAFHVNDRIVVNRLENWGDRDDPADFMETMPQTLETMDCRSCFFARSDEATKGSFSIKRV